ncbi:MAG TPA: tetratricopeptide repeat protein [Burkholderiales bacterium]|nr:tetratricopeptide repeat protein [Burkholderiales bacterium]
MTIMGPVLATQIRQFFAPYDLSLRYAWWPRGWSDPQVLASWGLLLLLAASVAWWGRRDQRIAVAGCFALIALLPTANIVAAPDFQADRYAHLALVGGALLAVVLLRPLARVHRLLPAGMLALWCLLVLAPITWARIGVWHDSERLWQDTLRRYPGWVFGWDLLAKHYLDHHQLEKAEPVLQRMLELERDNADARYNLALLSYNTERSGEAAAQLHTLLEQHPDHADGHCLLGRILIAEGRSDEGLAQLDAALRLEPRHVIARYLRARVCRQQGRLDAASADLETLVGSGQAPSAVWIELAQLRLQQNRVDDALAAAHRSVDQDARFAEGWDILGQALLAAGDIASAEAAVRQGLRGNPDDADLRYHLAEVLQRRGDPEAARTAATEALRLLGTAQRDWTQRARSLADGVR